ncbi:glycosyl transferase family 2 [Psychroflexus planctonicus]|uniref:Glycosyl transferase family 2 n=1 Tax=Psychroflexus planctonicus TaxID=1526575 RepID=A0ABQ1SGI4_9FLAO|nr:glycosyl transferase family 2 [Psychroflexus planctonicus]
MLNICIIIPAHNEGKCIGLCLQSLVEQTYTASEIIVVNDNSTDDTAKMVEEFSKRYAFIQLVNLQSSNKHEPGSKIINAFYKGFQNIKKEYDIICKFDADLIFPKNYLFEVNQAFQKNAKLGMFAGFCYVEDTSGNWKKEKLTNNDHIRGPIKAYRKECFKAIGGLKKEMGWDTVDELLARYYGWQTQTDENLKVKHLKPTGKLYQSTLAKRYGKALYKMDHGFILSFLSLLKLALLKKQIFFFIKGILSYVNSALFQKPKKMVNASEGKFIRNYRWKMIMKKFRLN